MYNGVGLTFGDQAVLRRLMAGEPMVVRCRMLRLCDMVCAGCNRADLDVAGEQCCEQARGFVVSELSISKSSDRTGEADMLPLQRWS